MVGFTSFSSIVDKQYCSTSFVNRTFLSYIFCFSTCPFMSSLADHAHFKLLQEKTPVRIAIFLSQNIPSHSTRPGKSIQSLLQTQHIYNSWLLLFSANFDFTHCSFSSQNRHLIFPPTPCPTSVQHRQLYTTSINPFIFNKRFLP